MSVEIDVLRSRPPEIRRCRGEGCAKRVEWVTVLASGKRMPVTHPLYPLRVHERDDGRAVTTIDGGAVHFVTCTAAKTFRKRARR